MLAKSLIRDAAAVGPVVNAQPSIAKPAMQIARSVRVNMSCSPAVSRREQMPFACQSPKIGKPLNNIGFWPCERPRKEDTQAQLAVARQFLPHALRPH